MRVILLLALVAPALSQTIYYSSYSDSACTTFGSSPSVVFTFENAVCSCFTADTTCSSYIKVETSGSGANLTYNLYSSDSTCTTSSSSLTLTDGTCGTGNLLFTSTAITGQDYTYACSASSCTLSSGNGAGRVAISTISVFFAVLFFYLAWCGASRAIGFAENRSVRRTEQPDMRGQIQDQQSHIEIHAASRLSLVSLGILTERYRTLLQIEYLFLSTYSSFKTCRKLTPSE